MALSVDVLEALSVDLETGDAETVSEVAEVAEGLAAGWDDSVSALVFVVGTSDEVLVTCSGEVEPDSRYEVEVYSGPGDVATASRAVLVLVLVLLSDEVVVGSQMLPQSGIIGGMFLQKSSSSNL